MAWCWYEAEHKHAHTQTYIGVEGSRRLNTWIPESTKYAIDKKHFDWCLIRKPTEQAVKKAV